MWRAVQAVLPYLTEVNIFSKLVKEKILTESNTREQR